jgi:hypothetical protein
MPHRGFGEIEHRVDIDPECQLPFLIRDLLNRAERRLVSRIVHEDIETAELSHRRFDDLAAVVG